MPSNGMDSDKSTSNIITSITICAKKKEIQFIEREKQTNCTKNLNRTHVKRIQMKQQQKLFALYFDAIGNFQSN